MSGNVHRFERFGDPVRSRASTGSAVLGAATSRLIRPLLGAIPVTPRTTRPVRLIEPVLGRWPVRADVRVSRTRVGDIPCEEVVPTAGVDPAAGVLLYLPGGGFLAGGPGTHRRLIADLAVRLRAPILVVAYRRLPATDIAGSVHDCLHVYRELTQRYPAGTITVIGDSAGGFLTFAATLAAVRSGSASPRALVGISPWPDLDCTTKTAAPTAAAEAFLPAQVFDAVALWGCGSTIDPALSPLHADDLGGLPPTLLLASDSEFLCPDAEAMAERLGRAGCATSCICGTASSMRFPSSRRACPRAGRPSTPSPRSPPPSRRATPATPWRDHTDPHRRLSGADRRHHR